MEAKELSRRWDGLIKFYQNMLIQEGTDQPTDTDGIAAVREHAREAWPALTNLINEIRHRPLFQNIKAGREMSITVLEVENVNTAIFLNRPKIGWFSVALCNLKLGKDIPDSLREVSDHDIIQHLETLIVQLSQKVEIKPIHDVSLNLLRPLIHGYVSNGKYAVSRQDEDYKVTFTLEAAPLDAPYIKPFELEPIERYQQICDAGCSLAAYEDDEIVGIALCEPHHWNQSLVVHEFHVLGSHQGRGIGRALMDAVINQAKHANLRIVACETQNTNVSAIRFYQHMGFTLDALDLSLYTNHDYPDGEIALWMKYKIL